MNRAEVWALVWLSFAILVLLTGGTFETMLMAIVISNVWLAADHASGRR